MNPISFFLSKILRVSPIKANFHGIVFTYGLYPIEFLSPRFLTFPLESPMDLCTSTLKSLGVVHLISRVAGINKYRN